MQLIARLSRVKLTQASVQACPKLKAGHQKRADQQDEEGSIIVAADASIQPRAVMIERVHALVAPA